MIGQCDPDGDFAELVDAYCSGSIDDEGVRRLETMLLEDAERRREFARYFHHHTEIQFAVRAGHATNAALDRVSRLAAQPKARGGFVRAWLPHPRARLVAGIVVGIALTSLAFASLRTHGFLGSARPRQELAAPAHANVAWLINAQDCRWIGSEQKPGRDMRAGKVLRLEQGLAEIEFEKGARIILQGRSGVELISEMRVRLLYGTLTARVPAQAHGFTVLSPSGRIVDLGTEFGLSVADDGTTRVKVFTGLIQVFPFESSSGGEQGVTIEHDHTASIDRGTVALDPRGSEKDTVAFVRAIVPPQVRTPRTIHLAFSRPVPGTLLDGQGQGTGLLHRLPGTGRALGARDPNLRLSLDRSALELTTTRSDLNTQNNLATGEYLGFRLSELGFTGKEDFELSALVPDIPALMVVGQFGLYAGVSSDKNIRGGLIRRPDPAFYRLFLVNNPDGNDTDIDEIGLITIGDDLRLTLRRKSGRYSVQLDNLTRNSSSTLEIAHPAFLDGEKDLYAGVFGANTQSDHRETLTIRELKATVWTTKPPSPTMADRATKN